MDAPTPTPTTPAPPTPPPLPPAAAPVAAPVAAPATAPAQPSAEPAAPDLSTLLARITELEGANARNADLAQRSVALAHLGELAHPDYTSLVPKVTLTKDGQLTTESRTALDAFKLAHQSLFKVAPTGTTPAGSGGTSATSISAEDAQFLSSRGVDPAKLPEMLARSPVARFLGYKGGLRGKEGAE